MVSTQAFAQASTMGGIITNMTSSWATLPDLFMGAAYILGIMFTAQGLFNFKDHVDEGGKGSHPLSTGVKKFIAGGMLFALPFMSKAISGTLTGGNDGGTVGFTNVHQDPGIAGLDEMAIKFIGDVSTPATYMLIGFAYLGGMVLLINGIIRLTKTAQEGARGPAGLGTLMTFVAAGGLFSLGQMIGWFSGTLFGTSTVSTYANISTDVLPADDANIVAPIIESLMIFIMIVGYIAFIRGWFVLKAFADGHQQATLAQALTFLLGGTLAINLGDLVNALQQTVGVSGITFQ